MFCYCLSVWGLDKNALYIVLFLGYISGLGIVRAGRCSLFSHSICSCGGLFFGFKFILSARHDIREPASQPVREHK